MLWIQNHENGRRLYFRDWRIHHFHCGVALIATGIALILRDLADLRDYLRNHIG